VQLKSSKEHNEATVARFFALPWKDLPHAWRAFWYEVAGHDQTLIIGKLGLEKMEAKIGPCTISEERC
jgi:hypothetical protein